MGNTVRGIEERLGGLEDRILDRLGYREYKVFVGETLVDPPPQIIEKPLSAYSPSQLQGFVDALGGSGNPISTYRLDISRLVDEGTIRGFNYWRLERSDYVSVCLPLEIVVMDARIKVLLGVIKIEGLNETDPNSAP